MQMIMRIVSMAFVGLVLAGCGSSTQFVSTWRSPSATPLGFKDSTVVAIVMAKNSSMRRQAEDTLAREITKHGAKGVAMYALVEEANPGNEDEARKALEAVQAKGAIVMRPVATEKELVAYSSPVYSGYYGGYYSHGWGAPYDYDIYTNTIISVETLVYSLEQNKLVWAGQSKTTNPNNVEDFVKELAAEVANQLEKQGLISG